jgi:predicted RNase H-like HicB family nuclease
MASKPRTDLRRVQLLLTFLVKQEGEDWTALCLELDIASCEKTEEEAVESLKGLIELYVEDCLAAGEVPIPVRPVPLVALQEFLRPPSRRHPLSLTTRQEALRPTSTASYAFA